MEIKQIKGSCLLVAFLLFMSGLMSYLVTGTINWTITLISTIGLLIITFLIIKFYK